MPMTKIHYVAISNNIASVRDRMHKEFGEPEDTEVIDATLDALAEALADSFTANNDKFDRERFLEVATGKSAPE